DIRSLQQTEQSVQLAQTQITDQIHVVEPARVVENGFNLPFLGTLTMLIDQELIAGGASYGQPNSDRTATAIGPMIIREAVLTEAAKRAGVRLTTEELVARVWVSAVPGTQLIEINASSEDAESAEGLANQIALVFMEQTQKQLGEPYRTRLEALQAQMTTLAAESAALQDEIKTNNAEINRIQGELSRLESDYAVKNENLRTWTTSYEELVFTAEQSSGSVIVTEPARVPESAAQNRLLYSTLAALVALAAGVALALVLDRWEDKLRDWEDVKGGLNLDVLGSISHIPTGPARPPYVIEDFRKLATSLRVLMREKNIRLLMVTSASAADGKSVVAAGLASALARGGSEVILIDADMRLPQQHRLFDLDGTPGLSGLLEAGDLMGLLKPTRDRRLRLMTAGSTLEDPIELLTSERLQEVLEYLSDQADVVILDTPPVLSAADAAYLAPLVESAMVVVRAGQTQRQAALNAVESLRRAGGQVIGAALNDVPLNGSSYTYYATNHKESGLIGRLWNPVKKWLERPVRKGP
ncbi:MAG: polysaccharide biosynthesis tyrosine autokinase, partial [Anaerolineae bacterium]|nr:polysaccharide biosynthesis tyrosine autokinase [Anaerolineae bacterium]